MSQQDEIRKAFANQHAYCIHNDAPITGRICEAIFNSVNGDTDLGQRILSWPGSPLADALPLRVAGGIHALHLSGRAPALAELYAGERRALDRAEDIIATIMTEYGAELMLWLDGPPQTNEAGRSSNFIAGFLWLASQKLPPQFEILEIGSSAGLNLLIDQYHYNLGGITVGPADAALRFLPEWRGPPPPDEKFTIASIKGCDIAAVDLRDPEQALRLTAYIWPEHKVRAERMKKAIEMVHASPPDLVNASADDWIEEQLKKPQKSRETRVLMHSIMWQYLPGDVRTRIKAAMEKAAAKATPDRPLAWMSLEANRETYKHELRIKISTGGGDHSASEFVHLARAHAHGAWVEWTGA